MLAEVLNQVYFKNTVSDYLTALTTIVIGILIVKFVGGFILRRFAWLTKKVPSQFFDFLIPSLRKNVVPLLYFGAFYIGMNSLTMNAAAGKMLNFLCVCVVTIYGIRFLLSATDYLLERHWRKDEEDEDDAVSRESHVKLLKPVIKVVVWVLGLIFLLDNLGFEISALVAGLGIGGVAVALAAQAVLGDLFSYFAIVFDRPFKIGDFIIIDNYLGVIEHVGIKTTRIRSLSGEQLVFSNTDLTNSRVRNFKRMERRRVIFTIGVTYQTSAAKLKEIPAIIKNIIEDIDDTQFDRAHFFAYGDFSQIFEIVYYVTGADYNKYMDIQQEINLRIKSSFEQHGIEFAFPTQTLYLHNQSNGKAPRSQLVSAESWS